MASNADGWMDFAQRSRDDGGLGLEKHQAAGLVGNLVNESGPNIDPWGRPGDDGTAWGSAQWRNERLTGLQNHASENGLDYRTPEAQQSWMRREFDTTHSNAYSALRAAKTPEEAATAVNRLYEVSADRSGHREASARRLFDGTTGPAVDGPTAIDTAMGRRSTGSTPMMAYAAPDEERGALNPAPPPGALNGVPTPDSKYAWLQQLGQVLQDMAPGIAQDPEHAKALEASAAASRPKAKDAGTWSTNYDPRTGIATQTNSLNPMLTRQFKYAAPKEEKDPVQQAADIGRVKSFQDYGDEIAKNGAASRASLDAVGPVEEALKNVNIPQGTLADVQHTKNKALVTAGFGGPELAKTVADTDFAVAGINKMVQEGRTLNGGMPGSLSNSDLTFLQNAQAKLGNTAEANQRIIDIYKQLHARRIELDNARQAYVDDSTAHPLGLDNGFRKQINDKWAAENAARDKALAAKETGAAPAKTATPTTAPKSNKTSNGVPWSIN